MRNLETIPASSLAGYCPESLVWSFLDQMTASLPDAVLLPSCLFLDAAGQFHCKNEKSKEQSLADNIQALGASAYYLIMGIPALNSAIQTASSPIPSIPPRRCSRELDTLIRHCLAFCPEDRPALQEIRAVVEREKGKERRALKGNLQEDSFSFSFWKEEML